MIFLSLTRLICNKKFQVQGLVNTFGDLRGAFAAVERINSVLSKVEIDEALAHGLEREIQEKEKHDEITKLFFVNGYLESNKYFNAHYMSALKSASNLSTYAWSGDVCLEGIINLVLFNLHMHCCKFYCSFPSCDFSY